MSLEFCAAADSDVGGAWGDNRLPSSQPCGGCPRGSPPDGEALKRSRDRAMSLSCPRGKTDRVVSANQGRTRSALDPLGGDLSAAWRLLNHCNRQENARD